MLRFISSVRLAIILIAAIAGLAVASTLYDLPEIFSSLPFRILVALFFLNLLTCSVLQWPILARRLRITAADLPAKAASLLPSTLTSEMAQAQLKEDQFKVSLHEDASGTYILARKNRLSLFAPHVLHIGLLVIIVGAFLTSFETEAQLMLGPGQTQPLPAPITEHMGEGSITVHAFDTVYDKQGSIDNWITTFDLTVGGKTYTNAVTKVNDPFKGQGLSIYQMAYRNHHVMEVKGVGEDDGDYAFPEGQHIPVGDNAVIEIRPMAEGVALLQVYDPKGALLDQKALQAGAAITIPNGVTLHYLQPYNYTVLSFKYSPAIPIVFAGFVISGLASLLFFFGTYRELRMYINEAGAVRMSVYSKSKLIRKQLLERYGVTILSKEVAHK